MTPTPKERADQLITDAIKSRRPHIGWNWRDDITDAIRAAEKKAREEEREACAKQAEEGQITREHSYGVVEEMTGTMMDLVKKTIATAIRARDGE